MPNPSKYINKNHTYVKGYVRRKRKANSIPIWFVLGAVMLLMVFISNVSDKVSFDVAKIAPIIYIAIGIVGAVVVYKRWKEAQKIRRGEVYQVEHRCPNCGRMNMFRYPIGSKAKGVSVVCYYCGRRYTH